MSGTSSKAKIKPSKEISLKPFVQKSLQDDNLPSEQNSLKNSHELLEPKYQDLYEKTPCL
jgi:hypothetical protein